MKKVDEMLQELQGLKGEVRSLLDSNKVEDAESKMAEIRSLEKKIELQKQLDEAEERNLETKLKTRKDDTNMDNKKEVNYNEVFVKYVRNLALQPEQRMAFTEEEKRALSSNTDADGKLLIPQDLQTKIKELKRNLKDMYDYVNIEPVSTATGRRVIEVEAAYIPFDGVAELVTIPDMGSPTFAKIDFAINDFKGLIEIPNSLLKDESADLMGYLARWIAKKMVATHNSLIFYADGTKAQGILGVTSNGIESETLTTAAVVKDFKTVLNTKLPTAIAQMATIFTNQTGFNYLDSLEDKQGRAYLQPDVTRASGYSFLGKEVVVFDDATLKNKATTGEAPFIIGSATEAVTYFDREKLSLATSTEAGFDNDATKVRAITRGDVKFVDKKALHILYSPVA